MKNYLLVFIIYLIVKVFVITNYANADVNPCFYNNTDYGYGYNSEGSNEHGQKSFLRFAQESKCNKYQQNIFDNVLINLKTKKLNNYIPGYTCDGSTTFQINCGSGGYGSWNISSNGILCNSNTELKFINTYSNPLYRCGDSPSIKRI